MKALIIVIFIITGINLFGSGNEILPLNIQPGFSFTNLLKAYPKGKIIFSKKDKKGKVKDCLFHLKVEDNAFWDSALINVKNGVVISLAYTRVLPLSKQEKINKIKTLFKKLKKKYGNKYEKNICKKSIKGKEKIIPLLKWLTPSKTRVVLTYAPFDEQISEGIFHCSLSQVGKNVLLKTLFNKINIPDDQTSKILFKDLK